LFSNFGRGEDDVTTVDIPAGAVITTTTIVYTEVATPTGEAPTGFAFAGKPFNLNAYQGGALIDGFNFEVPITLTLHHSETEIPGPEESFVLLYWDSSTSEWMDTSCGAYDRHPAEDWLGIPICHLSEFGLLAEGFNKVYLPHLIR